MASFLKPITRAKAEALLAGVLQRAAAYNSDVGLRQVRGSSASVDYVDADTDESRPTARHHPDRRERPRHLRSWQRRCGRRRRRSSIRLGIDALVALVDHA